MLDLIASYQSVVKSFSVSLYETGLRTENQRQTSQASRQAFSG